MEAIKTKANQCHIREERAASDTQRHPPEPVRQRPLPGSPPPASLLRRPSPGSHPPAALPWRPPPPPSGALYLVRSAQLVATGAE